MEETTEFAVHAGMFPTSMKVFRISGRDASASTGSVPGARASMKVFRISGRDLGGQGLVWRGLRDGLNESLPHKRKRQPTVLPSLAGRCRLNESLPHKRKRLRMLSRMTRRMRTSMKVFRISGRDWMMRKARAWLQPRLNESLPHKRKRLRIRI